MKYFTPETSKKLEEMGLERLAVPVTDDPREEPPVMENVEGSIYPKLCYSTLDICEIENAKKLFGEEEITIDEDKLHYVLGLHMNEDRNFLVKLARYSILSDEERIKYIEDFLETNK